MFKLTDFLSFPKDSSYYSRLLRGKLIHDVYNGCIKAIELKYHGESFLRIAAINQRLLYCAVPPIDRINGSRK